MSPYPIRDDYATLAELTGAANLIGLTPPMSRFAIPEEGDLRPVEAAGSLPATILAARRVSQAVRAAWPPAVMGALGWLVTLICVDAAGWLP